MHAPWGRPSAHCGADTGCGSAREKHDRLFRSFECPGAETGGVGGAGIGMAFAKRLAELTHGEVGYEREVGAGSTFWIELRRSGVTDAMQGGACGRAPTSIVRSTDDDKQSQLHRALLVGTGAIGAR